MEKLKIIAVGSSPFIAEEIQGICRSLLGDTLDISCAVSSCLTSYRPDEFYVCSNTQTKHLARYIPARQLFDLELKPTTGFFLELASIPEGETVHVFNNLSPYIEMLTSEFNKIAQHHLNFVPVPYAEIEPEKTKELLAQAHYIIGVDCFMGEKALLSEEYRSALSENIKLLAGHRTASLSSSCCLLYGLTDYYLKRGRDAMAANQEKDLPDIANTLQTVIEIVQSGILKAFFNQIGNYEDTSIPKASNSKRLQDQLQQQINDQLKILSFLQEKIRRMTLDERYRLPETQLQTLG